jgi:hypothetical protein
MADDNNRELVLRLAHSLGADLIETHISWVLLTPEFAWKLKKPLRLPFLDYSTVELRRQRCEDEVQLNRRLAAPLYLGVSRVTGTVDAPSLDGAGPTLDYAVRMKRFAAGALFSERLEAGSLDPAAVDRFAQQLAQFHAQAVPASASLDPDGLLPLRRAHAALAGAKDLLSRTESAFLSHWLACEWDGVRASWLERLGTGKVRDGHGDLHLANIVTLEEGPVAFDCIEFDPALRALDVVDDAAFALMDFAARHRPDLGWRFFNAWLEHSGEYEGVALLRFYLVSHALVRAQVEHLRVQRCAAAKGYAQAALAWTRPPRARLIITCGLPGSGKTFGSQRLLEGMGALRIRSDVERKRLFGLTALAHSRAQGLDLYTADATRRTYDRLLALAGIALRAGYSVVLDAAFLRRDERAAAQALADSLQLPFGILACEAPPEELSRRLRERSGDASEADGAVLAVLRSRAEPLTDQERSATVDLPHIDARLT